MKKKKKTRKREREEWLSEKSKWKKKKKRSGLKHHVFLIYEERERVCPTEIDPPSLLVEVLKQGKVEDGINQTTRQQKGEHQNQTIH